MTGSPEKPSNPEWLRRQIELVARFLGTAALLLLATFSVGPTLKDWIETILTGVLAPSGLTKVTAPSSVAAGALEYGLGWPQAAVLMVIILSVAAVVIVLIRALSDYFKD